MNRLSRLREIDALVAEYIFGWIWITRDELLQLGWVLEGTEKRVLAPALPLEAPEAGWNYYRVQTPNYSSYVGLAWEIVEEMYRRGFHILIADYKTAEDKQAYECSFGWMGVIKGLSVRKNSVSEAICEAALEALGIPLPEDSDE